MMMSDDEKLQITVPYSQEGGSFYRDSGTNNNVSQRRTLVSIDKEAELNSMVLYNWFWSKVKNNEIYHISVPLRKMKISREGVPTSGRSLWFGIDQSSRRFKKIVQSESSQKDEVMRLSYPLVNSQVDKRGYLTSFWPALSCYVPQPNWRSRKKTSIS